jgi:VCBS repeat-containing protein
VQTYTVEIADGHGGTATQLVTITINGTNDAAVITGDTSGTVVEAGGVDNGIPGTPTATGDLDSTDVDDDPDDSWEVIGSPTASTNGYGTFTIDGVNDTDVDSGDSKTVTAVNGSALNVGVPLDGTYGTLTLAADGTWSYALDNADPDTNVLAQGQTATDVFTYIMADANGATSSAALTITITGTNDVPIAVNDAANTPATPLHESNTQATTELVGPVSLLANDSDADAGETALLRVTRVDGTALNQTAGIETAIAGIYGTLFARADGTYRYVLDNTDPDTQALAAGQPVTEDFLYTAANNGGGPGNEASATLSIAILGVDDAPVITGPTSGTVVEAGFAGAGTPTATGDLLATDVDGPDDQWQPFAVPTSSLNGFGTFT